jgi:hypothetical protein
MPPLIVVKIEALYIVIYSARTIAHILLEQIATFALGK